MKKMKRTPWAWGTYLLRIRQREINDWTLEDVVTENSIESCVICPVQAPLEPVRSVVFEGNGGHLID